MSKAVLILLTFATGLDLVQTKIITALTFFFLPIQSSSVHYCRNSKPPQFVINSYCFNYEEDKKTLYGRLCA